MHLEHASGVEVELQHGRTDGHTDVDELAAVDQLSVADARARMTGFADSDDDGSPSPSPSATDPEIGPQTANLPWSVGIVANTTAGPVKLLMTTEQADELRDSLVWLTGDGDE